VLSEASQPFAEFPSQSPIPIAQEAHPQTPAAHLGEPLGHVQVLPQVPQLFVATWVLVSHPLILLPSQSPKPEEHVGVQTPALQTVVPLGLAHTVPHAPQLLVVELRLVSQPLLRLASQLPQPLAHAGVQTPATQEVVPCGLVHPAAHAPQFEVLVCRSVSQPLPGSLSQLAKPVLHDGVHAPAVHEVEPCALLQTLPHAPQFAVPVSEVSHPLARFPSQLP
jgi:hypothetical protein